ncbi:sensor histidine kinase [Pararcticibacter amylolyticus]|uniref:histidine kinase n=1 Tax=Pararcticibacter amylolyticus TaxID=2173175 RepID=A0A2U2PKN8_9SPHI|nr:ATP-binding protein [Pararcticibacter amylolyticus]PWG81960.1 hypothetical protein DDR33_02740 [Pararcticibacter amylolyticus]
MSNIKSIMVYVFAFLVISTAFFFLSVTFQEVDRYNARSDQNIRTRLSLQNLSRYVINAAVMNPDLLEKTKSTRHANLFQVDSFAVFKELDTLNHLSSDRGNILTIQKLSRAVRSQFSWILRSNVPDSIVNDKAEGRIDHLEEISHLIGQAILRTHDVQEQLRTELDQTNRRMKRWMILFIFSSISLLTWGITALVIQKRKSEKKSRTLEFLLNKANSLARLGNWEYNVEQNSIYWSDITREIHELGKDYELNLSNAINAYTPKHRDIIMARVSAALESGLSWDEELQIVTPQGQKKWVRTIGEAEFVNGKCKRIYGSFQDINILKQTEIRLKRILKTHKDYLLALDESCIVAMTDAAGTILSVNDYFCRISRYSREELLGRTHNIINSGYHSREFFRDLWKTISSGKIWRGEIRNKAKDGRYYWVYTTITPFLDKQGKPVRYLAVRFDITSQKEQEHNLKGLNEDLGKKAAELAASNNELEQFAYVASHDLQEPLRMVTGFLSQLEKKYADSLDEKAKKYIYFAVDGAKRMRQIILDLLEFSRVGRTELNKEYVDLKELVHEVKVLESSQIGEKRASVEAGALPVVFSYKAPLRQIILNLVDNALKYSRATEAPDIRIASEEHTDHWEITVSDNGIGIEAEYFERIFVIFQRLHKKDEYSGTGMGLAITKKIVENLGGKIWIESTPGRGSSFHFTLRKDGQNLNTY